MTQVCTCVCHKEQNPSFARSHCNGCCDFHHTQQSVEDWEKPATPKNQDTQPNEEGLKCDCHLHENQCCDVCTGWTGKSKDVDTQPEGMEERLEALESKHAPQIMNDDVCGDCCVNFKQLWEDVRQEIATTEQRVIEKLREKMPKAKNIYPITNNDNSAQIWNDGNARGYNQYLHEVTEVFNQILKKE